MSQPDERERRPLFTIRQIVTITIVFAVVFLLAHGLSIGVNALCKTADKIPSKWPLSLVQTRLWVQFPDQVHGLPVDLAISAAMLIGFFALVRWLSRRNTLSAVAAVLIGLALILCTNLIHGTWYGLVYPHQGSTRPERSASQYYHDAVGINSAGAFLRGFEGSQHELKSCHSRTHPPGAVLLFYALIETLGRGAAVSVAIAAVSVALSGTFLYRLLRRDFDRDTSAYVTLLLLLMPAVGVYYCASLDAVVAGCFLGVLVFLRHPHLLWGIAGMIVCLFCASWLTFAACFLGPVILGFEIITKRSVRRSLAVFLGVGVLHVVVWLLWSFNYFHAFRAATALENPHGFLLFAHPISYVMTRLENAGDILVFFGPFLLVLFVRGVRTMRRGSCPELLTLTRLGLMTLLAMFLTGAFRTGETARTCLFIYPYLMFPVAACLGQGHCTDSDKRLLLWLVFGQTLLMQALAGYYW